MERCGLGRMDSHEALDLYLDFLDTSSATEKDPIPTPHIDSVLHDFKKRTHTTQKPTAAAVTELADDRYESRLVQLEKQLSDLLQRSKEMPAYTPIPQSKHQGQSESSSFSKHTDSDELSSHKHQPRTSNRSKLSQNVPRTSIQQRGPPHRTKSRTRTNVAVTSPSDDRKKKTRLLMETQNRSARESSKPDDSGSSVQVLTKELDMERERRWKAEQAAGRLVEHVRIIQSQLNDVQKKHELTVVRSAQLEKELCEEKEFTQTLQGQVEELQDAVTARQNEIDELKHKESEQINTLRGLESNYRQLEVERIKEKNELTSKVRESEATLSGHQREIEMLRRNAQQLKAQLQQMQELLASRERHHQKELEKCKPLDSKEVQGLVLAEVDRERSKMEAVIEQHKQRVSEQQKAYQNLEDEFRLALRIEAERYQKLQKSYDEICSEVEACRRTAVSAVQKEQRATGVVTELTAMVKEQKGRISELNKRKQEALNQLKERITEMEVELTTKNKTEVKLQVMEEENCRLSSRVTAQESVIEGLREERKLWGKELAYQGAMLAQDKGRMEAQVEALSEEVKSLRGHLQNERNAIRVKEKQIEDQLQTIQQTKQNLASKDHELQSERLDWQKEQQTLHIQLEQTEAANQELQEQVAGLFERKEQLKEEVASAQEQAEQWESKYSKLKGQWDEKIQVISTLEENMSHLQQTFKEKEDLVVQERDQALEQARSHEQRLKSCDDAFREQLEAKQRSHDNHVSKIVAEKNQEIEMANNRVAEVEGEMRVLLTEMAREKKNMEAKFQKLSRTFQQLQQDITA